MSNYLVRRSLTIGRIVGIHFIPYTVYHTPYTIHRIPYTVYHTASAAPTQIALVEVCKLPGSSRFGSSRFYAERFWLWREVRSEIRADKTRKPVATKDFRELSMHRRKETHTTRRKRLPWLQDFRAERKRFNLASELNGLFSEHTLSVWQTLYVTQTHRVN